MQSRPETPPAWRPAAEPVAHRPGTFATGPRAVGGVVGPVAGGHRGRRGGPPIPSQNLLTSVGKGLSVLGQKGLTKERSDDLGL